MELIGLQMVKEFKFVNLFRAIAAFWVLLSHCMIWSGWNGISLPSGKIAVDLFMIISGYLMASNAFSRRENESFANSNNWIVFYIRRFFRLAPAYYLSLGFAFALNSIFLDGYSNLQLLQENPAAWPKNGVYDPQRIQFDLKNLIYHLSFLFGLHPSYSFSTFLPDWSLSLEMQFYFVFPFIWLLSERFGVIKTSLLLYLSILIVTIPIKRIFNFYEPSLLVFKLNYFLAGIILFTALKQPQSSTKINYTISLLVVAVLLTLNFEYHDIHLFFAPLLYIAMYLMGKNELNNKSLTSKLIQKNKVSFFSDISYSVYLFHGFFISLSGLIIFKTHYIIEWTPFFCFVFMFVFVSITTYLFSFVTFKFVEKPGILLGKNLIEKFKKKFKNTT
jgi:peptidoglycan/LPS O-acetylase OafA/YrhL